MSQIAQRRYNNREQWWRFRFHQNADGFWGDVEGPSANEIELAAQNVVVAVNAAVRVVMEIFFFFLFMAFVLFLLSFSQSYNNR